MAPEDCDLIGGVWATSEKESVLVDCRLPSRIRVLGGARRALPKTAVRARVVVYSVYDFLAVAGGEKADYGLYSYVLFPRRSPRAERFLTELIKTTGNARESTIFPRGLNLIYLPVRPDRVQGLRRLYASGLVGKENRFLEQFYDYAFARKILAQVCTAPSAVIAEVCSSDLSQGPYLLTYARPVTGRDAVPPPYLFVDLSRAHERAFGEVVAAYKSQVKQPDFSDAKRIDSFRLKVLNVVLTAADMMQPMTEAVAGFVYADTGGKK